MSSQELGIEELPVNIIAGVCWIFQSTQLLAEENLVFIGYILLVELEKQKLV